MNVHTEMKMDHAGLAGAKAATAPYHDPVWVVQRAWSVFRLPRLQGLIQIIIADLKALPAPEVVVRDLPEIDRVGCDPVAEALRACCEELRDASGIPGAEADRARHCREVRDYIAHQPPAWSETFAEALQEYRKAAARALESAFGRATAA
jgi:hypothetical protein